MAEIRITGCTNCPAMIMLDMAPGYACQISPRDENGAYQYIKQSKKWQPITPKWCPLKKGPIMLVLDKK